MRLVAGGPDNALKPAAEVADVCGLTYRQLAYNAARLGITANGSGTPWLLTPAQRGRIYELAERLYERSRPLPGEIDASSDR